MGDPLAVSLPADGKRGGECEVEGGGVKRVRVCDSERKRRDMGCLRGYAEQDPSNHSHGRFQATRRTG